MSFNPIPLTTPSAAAVADMIAVVNNLINEINARLQNVAAISLHNYSTPTSIGITAGTSMNLIGTQAVNLDSASNDVTISSGVDAVVDAHRDAIVSAGDALHLEASTGGITLSTGVDVTATVVRDFIVSAGRNVQVYGGADVQIRATSNGSMMASHNLYLRAFGQTFDIQGGGNINVHTSNYLFLTGVQATYLLSNAKVGISAASHIVIKNLPSTSPGPQILWRSSTGQLMLG